LNCPFAVNHPYVFGDALTFIFFCSYSMQNVWYNGTSDSKALPLAFIKIQIGGFYHV
jgi:hypothetical protein